MEGFALSERWNGWDDLDVMVRAARLGVAAGPLEPLLCEVSIELDDGTTTTLDSLDRVQTLLDSSVEPTSMEVWVAHVVEEDASVSLVYNGRWLQIYGNGGDWQRARQAYDAVQAQLAEVAGITTFKLPELPVNTVAEVRRLEDLQE